MNKLPFISMQRILGWLPYIIAGVGLFASFVIWFYFSYFLTPSMQTFLKEALPWIVLILGISLTLVFAFLIHLSQLSDQQSQSLEQVNKDLKKELLEHTHVEETKQRLEKALLQGQKLQAIGTLAGGIAHDFNNILYAIKGYVEMAREDVEKSSVVYNNLGKVLEASTRGQELIARILSFSRRQRHDFKPIYCQKTIESVLSLLKPTIPAGVIIIFHTSPKDYQVLADQTQLHQVIVNIINNGVDAMDSEGVITLKFQHLSSGSDELKQFPNILFRDYCKIEITDSGHGMDQTTLGRIFEPFFTTKEVGKGTGLGLATVHAIMKEHHGEIMVDSQLGHGTTFTLLLPEFKGEQHG